MDGLSHGKLAGPLTISTFPTFAAKWLVPRLGSFTARYPEMDVRIGATSDLVNFARDHVDLAVRQGQGKYAGMRSDILGHADLFPVCGPALMEGPHPLREPADLRHHHLLHNQRAAEWSLWLHAHGVEGVDPARGTRFSDDALALEAAIKGQGVAITREPLAEADLASGALVRPFRQTTPDLFAYYLVYPQEREHHPKIAAFREWIVEEMRIDPHWRT